MSDTVPVRRALLSVYDKTGLEELARGLHDAGVALVSTGSTAARIAAAGLPVTPVEEVTGFPECLDGRVKTLHPAVHAGILADRRLASHREQLAELEIEPFDLVVVNLYPFADDGGLRRDGRTSASSRSTSAARRWCARPPRTTRRSRSSSTRRATPTCWPPSPRAGSPSTSGAGWRLRRSPTPRRTTWRWPPGSPPSWRPSRTAGPAFLGAGLQRAAVLRYGENPHQRAALYRDPAGAGRAGRRRAAARQGDELQQLRRHRRGAARGRRLRPRPASRSSSTPTRAASRSAADAGDAVADAHRKAHACDPVSAFGGVIATNRPVTVAMAEQVAEVFTEVRGGPGVRAGALEVLSRKKACGCSSGRTATGAGAWSCARSAAGSSCRTGGPARRGR